MDDALVNRNLLLTGASNEPVTERIRRGSGRLLTPGYPRNLGSAQKDLI